MNGIATAVHWRHGTFVLFCLLAVSGAIALNGLPLELQPGGDRPEITITTRYSGASPADVENLVTRPIEERMQEVLGVREISSISRTGSSSVTLEFLDGNRLSERMVDVLNQLQQVGNLPPEVGESNVEMVSGAGSPMMWIMLTPKPGFQGDSNHYRDLVDNVILPRLRRVPGVGQFFTPGGQEREVEVRVDPKALAVRNLTIGDVVQVLRDNNRDVRGGPLVLGRREYRVRTVSRSQDLAQMEQFVLRRDAAGAVYLRDVASVEFGRKPQDSIVVFRDLPTVAIGVIRQVGANVPQVAQGVRAAIAEIEEQFDRVGEGIDFIYNYDESEYVNQAVELMWGNLLAGAALATLVLLLFLGSLRTVAVVAVTIPIAIISVFSVLALLGRSLNIISLAGLAFSVGIIVDCAIVVIENVYTHLQRGKSAMRAAVDGTVEVWPALLGSTLTNVVVFIPLLLVTGEVGQLYADIAIALSFTALFSLFAGVTLVPMLAGLFLSPDEARQMQAAGDAPGGNGLTRAVARASFVFRRGQGALENGLAATVAWALGPGRVLRRLLVLAIPVALIGVSYALLPPADFLPDGNRNLVIWRAEPLPGTSLPEAVRQSEPLKEFIRAQPEIERTWYVDRPGGLRGVLSILKPEFATAAGLDAMVERLRTQTHNFAGYRFLVATRPSIFRDPGKEFEVDLVANDLNRLSELEQQVSGQLRRLPGVRTVRSNFVTGAAELQIIPNRERLAEVGLADADVGALVETALGGRLASQFLEGKTELDVSVELKNVFAQTPEQLRQLPLYTGRGQPIQLGDVAEVRETTGPDVINHINLDRSVTLIVSLAQDAPLSSLVERAEREILAPVRAQLTPGDQVRLAGAADRLAETVRQLAAAFTLSVLITYLLLVALYRSFLYPVVIMATVPMAISGSLLSLIIANRVFGMAVQLDMITALGFIILTGIVVNNAILLVDRALQLQREQGQGHDESLYQATRDRLRAIFMAAATSVLGMLPLAVVPGQGAELYQGLGIVLTGGLAFATLLTPTVVPALMGLLYDLSGRWEPSSSPSSALAAEPIQAAGGSGQGG
ncbi:MAG: efflux RND transporter permease subunit [Candidatus Competibacteraceae bacterium]|nr:efflux RND transporter permease subunit [Candidatus Competibacteraceae bacterium]